MKNDGIQFIFLTLIENMFIMYSLKKHVYNVHEKLTNNFYLLILDIISNDTIIT